MATDYKIVVVPDTGGPRPCIECPQCLGLQLLCACTFLCGCGCAYMDGCMYVCSLLLGHPNFKDPYLLAQVVYMVIK